MGFYIDIALSPTLMTGQKAMATHHRAGNSSSCLRVRRKAEVVPSKGVQVSLGADLMRER